MTEAKAIKFNLGDVFPSNDPVSRWLISMSIISNDLKLILKCLIAAMKNKETAPILPEALYFIKLTSSHLFEAGKLIQWALSPYHPINPFFKGLPSDAKDELQKLQKVLFEDSFLNKILRPLRDSFFHYPITEDPNYIETLDKISDIETYYYFQRFSTFSRAVFADEVAFKLSYGNQEQEILLKNMEKTRDATITLLRFCDLTLAHYFSLVEETKIKIEDADGKTLETWFDTLIKEIIAEKFPEVDLG